MKKTEWKEPKKGTGRLRVSRDSWRQTVCRLIVAEKELEKRKADEVFFQEKFDTLAANLCTLAFETGYIRGQESVFNTISLWGNCRPLEGLGGADMAKYLRKHAEGCKSALEAKKAIRESVDQSLGSDVFKQPENTSVPESSNKP